MATPTVCQNQSNAIAKVLSAIFNVAAPDCDVAPGRGPEAALRKIKVWQCSTTPSTAATGQVAGDIVLDIGNDEVYRYISSNTFVNMSADS